MTWESNQDGHPSLLEPDLGSDVPFPLLYSTGHTDQLCYKVGGDCRNVGEAGGGIIWGHLGGSSCTEEKSEAER